MPDERPSQDEKIDLFEYIRVIYKHKKIVISMVLLSVCLNSIYVFTQPFKYKATVTFFPLNVREYKSGFTVDELEMKTQLVLEDLIISILKGREIADRIILDLDLKNLWGLKFLADTRLKLSKVTSISFKKGGVITLDVITGDPELSAKIANSYLDKLDNFNKELQLSTDVSLVQVIDRAVPPETRMPRRFIVKTILISIISFFTGVFFALVLEYLGKSGFKEKWKSLK